MLGKMGCTVDVAGNGVEALQILTTLTYDVILMDCMMPEMDGYEATRQIRTLTSVVKDHTVPIIAMTANAQAQDRAKCLKAGMNEYISKPVNRQVLRQLLSAYCNDKSQLVP